MLGRLLCILGLHQPIVIVPGVRNPSWYCESRWASSAFGRCARCVKGYQWNYTPERGKEQD